METNLDFTITTYSAQFDNIFDLVKEKNQDLQVLRLQGSDTENNFYKLSIENQ